MIRIRNDNIIKFIKGIDKTTFVKHTNKYLSGQNCGENTSRVASRRGGGGGVAYRPMRQSSQAAIMVFLCKNPDPLLNFIVRSWGPTLDAPPSPQPHLVSYVLKQSYEELSFVEVQLSLVA